MYYDTVTYMELLLAVLQLQLFSLRRIVNNHVRYMTF